MPRPRRNRRPPGQVSVICTGRGTHSPVHLKPDIQFFEAGGKLRIWWDTSQGPGPVTGFSDAEGLRTYDNQCGTCARHYKRQEHELGLIVMALAEHHGVDPDDNTPFPIDISRIDRA